MRINHNIAALNTYRQLNANQMLGNKSLEKLSSGLRINRAGDDAAGLAISEKMRGQIRGLEMASKNAQDGISLIQTAEGALNETHSILQRMRELAVQAASDSNTFTDRKEIQKEINQLIEEIDRVANTTEFNTKKLIEGSMNNIKTYKATGTDATSNLLTDLSTSGASITFSVIQDGKVTNVTLSSDYSSGNISAVISDINSDLSGTGITAKANETGNGIVLESNSKFSLAGADLGGFGLSGVEVLAYDELGAEISATNAPAILHIGANEDQNIAIEIKNMDSNHLGYGNIKSYEGSYSFKGTDATSGLLADLSTSGASITFSVIQDDKVTNVTLSANFSGKNISAVISSINTDLSGTGIIAKANETGTGIVLESNSKFSLAGADLGKYGLSGVEMTEKTITVNNLIVSDVESITEGTAKGAGGVLTQEFANKAITIVNNAIEQVSAERSKLGAYQNRLEHTINNLGTSAENLSAAESRIRDVDMAKEMMEFTKMNILQQAATAMLAQANMQPQMVLQLLGR